MCVDHRYLFRFISLDEGNSGSFVFVFVLVFRISCPPPPHQGDSSEKLNSCIWCFPSSL